MHICKYKEAVFNYTPIHITYCIKNKTLEPHVTWFDT